MRRFTSYGPVNTAIHFGVERAPLVEQCVEQLIGEPEEGGHFFTIWAPRQCGKTWLMRRAITEIRKRHGDRFATGALSMQGLLDGEEGENVFFGCVPGMFSEGFAVKPKAPTNWNDWRGIFSRTGGLFDKPLLLLIDEFDALPTPLIDKLVGSFRKLYLARDGYNLHGLALVGVRAILGVDSARSAPFNVQRALHVPNLTREEVVEMFGQYEAQSGQQIAPEVVETIFTVTRGQPGLVGWFGELLTEKYNPGLEQPITPDNWDRVLMLASRVEPNATILNLIKKAKGPYREHVVGLFGKADVPFSFDQEWCSYLYTNGILDFERGQTPMGELTSFCRFSSPFVQSRLHSAFTDELVPDSPILVLDPLDTLEDAISEFRLDAAALCERYKAYLGRLKAAGLSPFVGEERRSDVGLREAVGHFHLYAWLREAVRTLCSVSPEFPTGNGKVDLMLRSAHHRAVIEVKSFRTAADLPIARRQAARYAKSQNLEEAALAMFVPVSDEEVLRKLAGDEVIDGVRVVTVTIGWT